MQSDWREPEHTAFGESTIIIIFSQSPEDAMKCKVNYSSLH